MTSSIDMNLLEGWRDDSLTYSMTSSVAVATRLLSLVSLSVPWSVGQESQDMTMWGKTGFIFHGRLGCDPL